MKTLPVSSPAARGYLVWAFPLLLGYGAVSIGAAPSAVAVGALIICMAVVLTGWMSFSIVPDRRYNDLLFAFDVALLSLYLLLIGAASQLGANLDSADVRLWTISGLVFTFYAAWNIASLGIRDPSGTATTQHLILFTVICVGSGAICYLAAVFTRGLVDTPEFDSSRLAWTTASRVVSALIWIAVLLIWHVRRAGAAVVDAQSPMVVQT